MGKMTICVYGAASDKINSVFITETEKLGEEIARRHHQIIYGGGASGVMGACARGAAEIPGQGSRALAQGSQLSEAAQHIIKIQRLEGSGRVLHQP